MLTQVARIEVGSVDWIDRVGVLQLNSARRL
jgi:hypothetical protein